MSRLAAFSVALGAFLALGAAPAGAGLPEAHEAVQEARQDALLLGYAPCDPVLVPLDKYGPRPEAWAWASWPETFGTCEVGWSEEVPAEETTWVAQHEVCHLATGPDIAADPARTAVEDHYHEDPAFGACLDALATLPEPLPERNESVNPTIHLPGGAVTDYASIEEDPEDDARLCADLQEVKPWIDWGCPK